MTEELTTIADRQGSGSEGADRKDQGRRKIQVNGWPADPVLDLEQE
jgi:hypothetical protein